MGWQKLYIEPRLPKNPTPSQSVSVTDSPSQPTAPVATGGTPPSSDSKNTATPRHAPETRTVSTDLGDVVLSDGAAVFKDWNLKSYKLGITADAAAVDLKSVVHEENGAVILAFDDPAYAYLKNIQGEFKTTARGQAWSYEDANVKLSRDISTVAGEPYVNAQFTAEFKGKRPNLAYLTLTASSFDKDPEAQDRQLLYWANKSLERIALKDTIDQKEIITPVKYVAASNRYFIMTLVNASAVEAKGSIVSTGPSAGRISLVYPITSNSVTIPVRAYFGAKELETLRRVDPALDNAVDLGWFQIIAYPLLKLLKFFNAFVGNYGIAIILLTVLLKIATFPLTYKSMKSMKEMAKLQPQLAKLKEKHKDDKETLNREMMAMMKTHGYNPMAGCLPMLLQMPIFFALYRVLYSSIELFHAPFALWIHDLSAQDPFYVTPVLLSGTMFLQQKLSPQTATDPAQQKMMQFMPLMFGAFMINLPSGLTLYMLTNAVTSIIQQLILNKKLDVKPAANAVARAR